MTTDDMQDDRSDAQADAEAEACAEVAGPDAATRKAEAAATAGADFADVQVEGSFAQAESDANADDSNQAGLESFVHESEAQALGLPTIERVDRYDCEPDIKAPCPMYLVWAMEDGNLVREHIVGWSDGGLPIVVTINGTLEAYQAPPYNPGPERSPVQSLVINGKALEFVGFATMGPDGNPLIEYSYLPAPEPMGQGTPIDPPPGVQH